MKGAPCIEKLNEMERLDLVIEYCEWCRISAFSNKWNLFISLKRLLRKLNPHFEKAYKWKYVFFHSEQEASNRY